MVWQMSKKMAKAYYKSKPMSIQNWNSDHKIYALKSLQSTDTKQAKKLISDFSCRCLVLDTKPNFRKEDQLIKFDVINWVTPNRRKMFHK